MKNYDIRSTIDFDKLIQCHEDNAVIFSDLIQNYKTNSIIPFLGAGISAYIYPLWGSLLEQLALKYGVYDRVREFLDLNMYEKAASLINKEALSYDFFNDLLIAYNPEKINNKPLSDTLKLIPKVWDGNIITTNFDRLIEKSFSEDDIFIEVGLPHLLDTNSLFRDLQRNSHKLIKLHGDILEYDKLILTEESYDLAYGSIEQIDTNLSMPKFLKQALTSKSLFFMGCSLSEDRTLNVVKSCIEQGLQHFALVELPKETYNKENPFKPIYKTKNGELIRQYNDRRRHLASYNIRRIWYPYGMHEALYAILEKLCEFNVKVSNRKKNGLSKFGKSNDKMEKLSWCGELKYDPFEVDVYDHIIKRGLLEFEKRMNNEVFAIELLTEDIVIKKWGFNGEIQVILDRENVKYAIVTDEGKKTINRVMIHGENKRKQLMEIDFEIQKFLNSNDQKNIDKIIKLSKEELMLRWASAGIIAIVEHKNKKWIPLFYRDKKPYGWNIALGDSERQFDNENNFIYSVNEEHNFPSLIMLREFSEEFLILENNPENTKNCCKYVPFIYSTNAIHNTKSFNEKHLELRKKYDDLDIIMSGNRIRCEFVKTNASINIKTEDNNFELDNVLVSFNLLELGIEVVQVVKFKLDDSSIMLDGEILTKYDQLSNTKRNELVRMPIALISYDYLENIFKGDISNLKYTEELTNPSILVDDSIVNSNYDENIILFDYDLKQRLKVINDNKKYIGETELERYRKSFELHFKENNGNVSIVFVNLKFPYILIEISSRKVKKLLL